jgi:hypothetical protein
LGTATAVDSLEVLWPSGLRQNYASPALNRRWLLVEGRTEMVEISPPADGDPFRFGLQHEATSP